MNNLETLQSKKEQLNKLDSHIFLLQEKVKNITNWILDEDLTQAKDMLSKFELKSIQLQDEIERLTNNVEIPTKTLNRK